MNLSENIQMEMDRIIRQMVEHQSPDGTWRYCFESGPMTDAYFLMMLRALDYDEEKLIFKLYQRLINTQQSNGAWRLFEDEGGNLSATVEAYAALLYSGYVNANDENMKKAEEFILGHGGLENSHPSTKFMLALHDLYPWPNDFPLPLFLLNIPSFLSFSFYKFSSYVRAHLAPVLIIGHKKYTIQSEWKPDLSHLYLDSKTRKPKRKLFSYILRLLPINRFSRSALKKAETYMMDSIESDGTLYSYASATFYMVYALLSLGYRSDCPYIQHAIEGLKSMIFEENGDLHLQNSPSTIWDTSLMSYALQEAGIPFEDPAIKSSVKYLQTIQQDGSWGFSESNTIHPDIDDTQAALRAISRFSLEDQQYRKTWNAGVNWLLTMQNDDGGWGAFERNQYKVRMRLFPIENFQDTAIDPSTADLTGRTLEFLGNYVNMTALHPQINAGVRWLIKRQEENGSWYGRWGVSYVYGTWAAVTGMRAVGISNEHPSIQKAVQWLKSIQQLDGGWGESCKSDKKRAYTPLPYSTVVQTAWAVDALISISEKPTPEIDRGIRFLTNYHSAKSLTYPTGAGLPGHFYIFYHSYNSIWPLVTLSHYLRKYK